jgi:hypothetical protein
MPSYCRWKGGKVSGLSRNRNSSDRSRSVHKSAYNDALAAGMSNSGRSGTHHRNSGWGREPHPMASSSKPQSGQMSVHSLSPNPIIRHRGGLWQLRIHRATTNSDVPVYRSVASNSNLSRALPPLPAGTVIARSGGRSHCQAMPCTKDPKASESQRRVCRS